MAPKTLTVDQGTNTDDVDYYFEIKKLKEQNSKLLLSLQEEREKYRFLLSGISRNLASHQQSLSDSLRIFQSNMYEQGKVLSNNVDIFKSITVRDRTTEKTNKGSNGCSEDRNETPILGATGFRPMPLRLPSRAIAQIQPMPRIDIAEDRFADYFKWRHGDVFDSS